MTAVYYADIAALPLPDLAQLPADRASRIRAALRPIKGKQLAYAWLLLKYAVTAYGEPSLLARYQIDGRGKPYFADSRLQFSLSHSENYVACAISDEGCIGVDIQVQKSIPEPFYAPYFSQEDLKILPQIGFTAAWAQKEALLKALGTGWATKTSINALTRPLANELLMFGTWLGAAYLAVCSRASAPPIIPVRLGDSNGFLP